MFSDSLLQRNTISYILTQTPNATRNWVKFERSLFRRKTWMIYVGQLSSTKLLGTLIPFFRSGSLSCVLIGQNTIFLIFVLSVSFKKSNLSFCHSLTSVCSDKQCLVQNYRFSSVVFHIKIGCTDIETSFTRKSIQCNAKSASL